MTVADLRALLAEADLPWTPVDQADPAVVAVIGIVNQLPSLLASFDDELASFDAELDRLRKLEPYVSHLEDCDLSMYQDGNCDCEGEADNEDHEHDDCTCGLDAARGAGSGT